MATHDHALSELRERLRKAEGSDREIKQCPYCGTTFSKLPSDSPFQWRRRRYCSRSCGSLAMNARNHTESAADRIKRLSRPVDGGCWEWCGPANRYGYGFVTFQGVKQGAHRLAYEAFVGQIPEGMHVCHACDNRRCVNPSHLFLGTGAENTRDRDDKGRQARGHRIHTTKLTEDQVREIRRSGETHAVLARQYGVHESNIIAIRQRKTWKYLND